MAEDTSSSLRFEVATSSGDGHEGGFRDEMKLVHARLTLRGYQLYAVEQWVVDRTRGVSTILVSASSDPPPKVTVDVYTPHGQNDRERSEIWERLMAKARNNGMLPRQTSEGFVVLPVGLLNFDQNRYTLVPIPGGDFALARDALYTNINMRRLGFGGRTAVSLAEPSSIQMENCLGKYGLPATSNVRSFQTALLSLIKLVQAGLAIFGLGPLCLDASMGTLREPDGLLCDTTMEGLRFWRATIGDPLLGPLETSDSVLPAPLLAGLLSVVVSVRSRLLLLNVPVTLDPFEERAAFLRAFDGFVRYTRHAPAETSLLTVQNILHLRSQAVRAPQQKIKQVLQHALEDLHLKGESTTQAKGGVLDEATQSIDIFASAVSGHPTSHDIPSVVNLWKGRYSRDKLIGRTKLAEPSTRLHPMFELVDGVQTDGEEETGLGSKIIRGVSKTTRKFGDELSGLLDKTVGWPGQDVDTRLRHSQPLSSEASRDSSAMLGASTMSEPARGSTFQSLFNLSRPGSAQGMDGRHDTSTEADASTDLLTVPRPPEMRRAASETGAMPSITLPDDSVNKVLEQKRWRRYSFSCERDAPQKDRIPSWRRLKMEYELYEGVRKLHEQEAQLAQTVMLLTKLDGTFARALEQISPVIDAREAQLSELQLGVAHFQAQVDVFAPPKDDHMDEKKLSGSPLALPALRHWGRKAEENGKELDRDVANHIRAYKAAKPGLAG